MINTIFWFANNIDEYRNENVSDKTICFIKDTGEIYLNGVNYGKTPIEEIINNSQLDETFADSNLRSKIIEDINAAKKDVKDIVEENDETYKGLIRDLNDTLTELEERTIEAVAGPNINSVGTPSVSATTSSDGKKTILTFDYLKGTQGNPLTYNDLTNDQKREIKGEPGHTPVIQVGNNGNWYVDGVDTGTPARGASGTTVRIDEANSSVSYAVGTSSTIPPTSGWQSTIPEAQQGKYLWCRDITKYTDGNSTTTYGVSYWAIDGNSTGGDKIDESNTWVKYSTVKTYIQPHPDISTFTLDTPPALEQGDYLWILTRITYVGHDPLDSYSVSRVGADSEIGDQGSDLYYTHFAYATSPDGRENFSVTPFTGATYIGVCRDKNRLDPDGNDAYTKYVWTRWKGENGDSSTIDQNNTWTKYSTVHTERLPDDSTFILSSPGNLEQGDWSWSLTQIAYVGGPIIKQYAVTRIGMDGKSGTAVNLKGSVSSLSALMAMDQSTLKTGDGYMVNGLLYVWDGENWNEIGNIQGPAGKSQYFHVAWANSADGLTDFTVSPVAGASYSYMGTCVNEEVADPGRDRANEYKWVYVKGGKGDPGDTPDPIVVSLITEYYLASNQETGITNTNANFIAKNGDNIPLVTKERPYLWNYELSSFSDGNSYKSPAVIVGRYTEDGRGILRIDEYYMVSNTSEAPSYDNPSWLKDVAPTTTNANKYLWNYNITVYTDNTTERGTIHQVCVKGDPGDTQDIEDFEETLESISADIQKKGDAIGKIATYDSNGNLTGITDYMATAVGNSLSGTYSKYTSGENTNTALATLFAKINLASSDIATIMTKMTNSSSEAQARTKFLNYEAALDIISDLSGSKASLSSLINKDGVIKGASIATAINALTGEGTISLNADKINFNSVSTSFSGAVLAVNLSANKITSGTIDTDNITISNIIKAINKDKSLTIDADRINMAGVTILSDNVKDSNGNSLPNIITSTIAATTVKANNLKVNAANIDGTITANALQIKSGNTTTAALNSDGSWNLGTDAIKWNPSATQKLSLSQAFLQSLTTALRSGASSGGSVQGQTTGVVMNGIAAIPIVKFGTNNREFPVINEDGSEITYYDLSNTQGFVESGSQYPINGSESDKKNWMQQYMYGAGMQFTDGILQGLDMMDVYTKKPFSELTGAELDARVTVVRRMTTNLEFATKAGLPVENFKGLFFVETNKSFVTPDEINNTTGSSSNDWVAIVKRSQSLEDNPYPANGFVVAYWKDDQYGQRWGLNSVSTIYNLYLRSSLV